MKDLLEYSASKEEIETVTKAINENGYWESSTEFRMSTYMTTRIEKQIKNGKPWFITTVNCEQEIMIPAKTIERAIVFKNIYEDFQFDLINRIGWASWSSKNKP